MDSLGGAALPYWEPINSVYGLDIVVVNSKIDPTFSFMTVDRDGVIRMDCSSPYAMAGLVGLKDRYQVAFANDPDSNRHVTVTPSTGLLNTNHYLAVPIQYLLTHRPDWPPHAAVGRTLVSSSMIDRVVQRLGRRISEAPVGFKWFVSKVRAVPAERRVPERVFCAAMGRRGPLTKMAHHEPTGSGDHGPHGP